MDHPLRSDKFKSLRRGLYDLLLSGFSIPRQSNIVFVCGGNAPGDMRKLFQSEFEALLPGYQFFEPEFAMRTYWTLGDDVPFDITTFEEMISQLSHSIVVFPEAPGSLVETGYFSAKPEIASKIVLALNRAHIAKDSFILIGPARKIADVSIFHPHIDLVYDDPDFKLVSQRILDRAPLHLTRRTMKIQSFADTSSFELFALVQCLVSLLRIATIDDIEFFMRGLFSGTVATSKIKQIVSILVGSSRLVKIGSYGHLAADPSCELVLQIKDGAKTTRDVLMLDLSTGYIDADPDFLQMLGS